MGIVEENNDRAGAMKKGADVEVMKPITSEAARDMVKDMMRQTESF